MFTVNSTTKSTPYKLLFRHCRAFASSKAELYRVSFMKNLRKIRIFEINVYLNRYLYWHRNAMKF